jgi:histidinol-phosphate aminotransferase
MRGHHAGAGRTGGGPPNGYDLGHHGDREATAGLVDLAVNVRVPQPPRWLLDRIAASLTRLAAYPDPVCATEAIARRHGREPDQVLVTSGAAEAFVLIARALEARRPTVVHPQFTEPEAALRAAGRRVERVILAEKAGFALDPALIPGDADLLIVCNPTNPTAVLHPADSIAALARPGRTLVIDEAFIDAIPGESQSLAAVADLPGRLIVIRSLTKTWGLAGLRAGYLLTDPATAGVLRAAQPLWPVSAPALAAAEACCEAHALDEADRLAREAARDRRHLESRLADLDDVRLPAVSDQRADRAPFVLVRVPAADKIRLTLRERGFAVRRADTFPGLGPDWLRIAVRGRDVTDALIAAWPREAEVPPGSGVEDPGGPDHCGKQRGVRQQDRAVVGGQLHVGEVHVGHQARQHSAELPRPQRDLVPDRERPGQQQHQAGEQVSERLLRGDAEDHAGDCAADQQSFDRDAERAERSEDHEEVADQQAHPAQPVEAVVAEARRDGLEDLLRG